MGTYLSPRFGRFPAGETAGFPFSHNLRSTPSETANQISPGYVDWLGVQHGSELQGLIAKR